MSTPDLYMLTDTPEYGPHHHDATRIFVPRGDKSAVRACGYVFRFIAIRDGVPECAGEWVGNRFSLGFGEGYKTHIEGRCAATWSWGLGGIIATDKFAATTFAQETLGEAFKGIVR